MIKYAIDLVVGFVVGLGFGLFGLLTTEYPWGWGWGWDLVRPFVPRNEFGDPVINEYIVEPLVYLAFGAILFGIYVCTPFYRRRHQTGLKVLSLFLSFFSFFIGVVLPYVMTIVYVVFVLLPRHGPNL